MAVLHVIRRPNDRLAFDTAGRQGREATVLLIQDGVRGAVPEEVGAVYAAADDVQARGVASAYPVVEPVKICELIVGHDRVFVW
jgi:sulfur transfer complex TusBCD TusB component (DsrH family)